MKKIREHNAKVEEMHNQRLQKEKEEAEEKRQQLQQKLDLAA